ncbi:hypothetical protein DW058_17460 [Clostridiaceae bacterium AF42-6]|nr:hypothetical protein DW058_17460 [Clostridiaceae bacterium AF42-6]
MFRVSDKIKLMKAFEYQLERIKSTVTYEKYKISRNEAILGPSKNDIVELEKYWKNDYGFQKLYV